MERTEVGIGPRGVLYLDVLAQTCTQAAALVAAGAAASKLRAAALADDQAGWVPPVRQHHGPLTLAIGGMCGRAGR